MHCHDKSAICLPGRSYLPPPPVPSPGTAQVLVSSDGGALAAILRPPVAKF